MSGYIDEYDEYGPWGKAIEEDRARELNPSPEILRKATRVGPKILNQQRAGKRPKPSATLTAHGGSLTKLEKGRILDMAASICDQPMKYYDDAFSRGSRCVPFAMLIQDILSDRYGIQSKLIAGKATYKSGKHSFFWHHAWLETEEGEIIDGNVDLLSEHPLTPENFIGIPYWGPKDKLPKDRVFEPIREVLPSRRNIEIGKPVVDMYMTELDLKIFSIPSKK